MRRQIRGSRNDHDEKKKKTYQTFYQTNFTIKRITKIRFESFWEFREKSN